MTTREVVKEKLQEVLIKQRGRLDTAIKSAQADYIPFYVPYDCILQAGPEVAGWVDENTPEAISILRNILVELAKESIIGPIPQLDVGIINLPKYTEKIGFLPMADIKAKHINRYISTEGIANHVGQPVPLLANKAWACDSCGEITYQKRESRFHDFTPRSIPSKCARDGCPGSVRRAKDKDVYYDEQTFVLQELPGEAGEREPRKIFAVLKHSAVGKIQVLHQVSISGFVRLLTKKPKEELYDYYVDVCALEEKGFRYKEEPLPPEEIKKIEEIIRKDKNIVLNMAKSLIPYIRGNEIIKIAALLQQIRGLKIELPGITIPDCLHITWLSDPGLAKTICEASLLSNGGITLLDETYNSEPNKVQMLDDTEYKILGENIPVFSLTPTLDVVGGNAVKVMRRRTPVEIIRLTTASGRGIRAHPKHHLFRIKDGKIGAVSLDELREGDYIAVSRVWPYMGAPQKIDFKKVRQYPQHTKQIQLPTETSTSLLRFVGYLVTEGHIHKSTTLFTNSRQELIEDYAKTVSALLNIEPKIDYHPKRACRVRISSVILKDFLKSFAPGLFEKSANKYLPDWVFKCSDEEIAGLLDVLFSTEGSIYTNHSVIEFSTTSSRLAEQVMALLMRFGIFAAIHSGYSTAASTVRKRKVRSFKVNITGYDNLVRFNKFIKIAHTEKRLRLEKRIKSAIIKHSARDVVPEIRPILRELKGLFRCGGHEFCHCFNQYLRGIKNPTRSSLSEILSNTIKKVAVVVDTLSKSSYSWDDCKRLRGVLHISAKEAGIGMGFSEGNAESAVLYYEKNRQGKVKPRRGTIASSKLSMWEWVRKTCYDFIINNKLWTHLIVLSWLLKDDIYWDKVERVSKIKPENGAWLYDVQVDGYPNVILSNGIVSHNSTIGQRISEVSPAGSYIMCPRATTAATTAMAERDKYTGEWRLVAGAIPRSAGGVSVVDELDKVPPGEIGIVKGIREVLAQGTLTIHSGGIHATLPADTCLFFMCNPPSGRLTQEQLPGEQLPKVFDPSLLSIAEDTPLLYINDDEVHLSTVGEACNKYFPDPAASSIVKVDNLLVPSFDYSTFSIGWRPVSAVLKHKANKLLDVCVDTGRSVSITPNHSILVFKDASVRSILASELKVGDWVVIPLKIPPPANKKVKIDLIREFLTLNKKLTDKIRVMDSVTKTKEPLSSNTKTKEDGLFLYCIGSKHKIPAMIKVDKHIMRLLGYYCAEGSLAKGRGGSFGICFSLNTDKDKQIIKKIQKAARTLGCQAKVYAHKKEAKVVIYSRIIQLLFEHVFGIKRGSINQEVPEIVFNVSPPLQKEFIKCYFEGDAGVTTSKKMACGISYICNMLGIASSTAYSKTLGKKQFRVFVPHLRKGTFIPVRRKIPQVPLDEIKAVVKAITNRSSISNRKVISLNKWVKLTNGPYTTWRIKLLRRAICSPITRKYDNKDWFKNKCRLNFMVKKGLLTVVKEERHKLKKFVITPLGRSILTKLTTINSFLTGDLTCARVKTTKLDTSKNRFVYDFFVPGHENFVAGNGGIMCHNSRMDLMFVSYDIPEPSEDRKVAEHIMAIVQKKEKEEIAEPPVYDEQTVRKYIQLARMYKPSLSDETAKYFTEYYVGLRKIAALPGMPIPIGRRQIETLVKLSAAFAKATGNKEITIEHAKMATELLKEAFKMWKIDIETGIPDIDLLEGRPSKGMQATIRQVTKYFKEKDPQKKGIPETDVLIDLQKLGIKDPQKVLETMIKIGELYKPSARTYSLVQ